MNGRELALLWLLSAAPALAAGEDGGAPDAGDVRDSKATDSFDRAGAQRLAEKALARIRQGSWGEAADLLRLAHDRDPKNAAIATDLGFTLSHLGVRQEAERLFKKAIELDPGRFYAYVNLAELWASDPTRWQRRDEMTAFLDQAVRNAAGDAKARAHIELRLAELQRSLGRTTDARAHLQRLSGPTVPAQVRQRAAQLIDEVDAEAHARALEDWPAPTVTREDQAQLAKVSTMARRVAFDTLDALVARWPAWGEARWQRARLLEKLGQFNEATADLAIVVQLSPSHAQAWRRLGTILALHGGRFAADRADQALRQALVLEPSWSDLRELRKQVAAKPSRRETQPDLKSVAEPTAKARQLLQDAQSWIDMDAPERAPPLLRQALAESPGFVEAAAALFRLEHAVPEATIKALWNDGAALWRLAAQVIALRTPEAEISARPWIDRAVELDVQEARFARASLRAAADEPAGALEDLRNYVAAEPAPPRLEEARALRVTLTKATVVDSPERLAQLRLAADQPAEALAALGGACAAGLPFDNLLAMGRVYEYMGDAHQALSCYQIVIAAQADASRMQRARERLGAATAGLPVAELQPLSFSLRDAAQAGVALASLSLARLAESQGQWLQAEVELRAFFAAAPADEPRLDDARVLQERISDARARERIGQKQRLGRFVLLFGLGSLIGLGFAFRRWARRPSLRRALRVQPLLFPALSQAIGKIRHDVIKHRASALGLLSDPTTNREEVARALLEPTPASHEVSAIFQQLAQEARGLGLHLRPRDPVFGPLVRDLERVEELLGRNHPRDDAELRLLDQRLRGIHADRLQGLLRSGPCTLLDASLLARWIDGVANEPGRTAKLAPGLFLQAAQIAFPMNEPTLRSIFSNLLRNAVDAVAMQELGSVQVRVEQGRDVTGRRTVSLMVADSSPQPLCEADIETRPADRGLGIVRETARRWGGQTFVRPEPFPFCKAVGVRFPAPPEAIP